ncbi:hypothetical protein Q5H92_17320 [Hymenobacter sp. M29]|uniref:Uncharacterized protein n=1 Tax=Hymenobacter mellowenesis TaxID=3063995 RepID=A0ABT9AE55_9BACT|nr:hypothetical protein [Hymenobacter sp. M29]MDO7848130.1 hypothetical protein [Hymenobacter sp. M29]
MKIIRSAAACLPLAFLLLACSRHPTASRASRFVPTPPTIDGQATDWTDSLRYDPVSKLQYQVLNDGRQVYLRLKAADPATQAKIVRLGLTVWLDTTGRNQHQFGVHFPLGGPLGARPGTDDGSPRPGANPPASDRQEARRERMTQALTGLREMELLNYKGNPEPTLTDAQSQLGVKAALALDDQENLIYELAVPMRLLYRKLPALTGRPAVVGVTLAGGKFSMPAPGSGGIQGGMGGGGMGGMRGGGMGGGGMRGGSMGGGGMRGGGGRGGYSGGGQQSAPIALKTSVTLTSH